MRARSLLGMVLLGQLGACGSQDGLVALQPPLVQSLALGEQPGGRYRLAASINAPDSGVLRMRWDATQGSISVDNALQTEWTLPAVAGAYPIRLTVEDALGGMAQALVVVLHDPAGRSEVTPATFASFKQGQLVSSETQHPAFQRGVGTSEVPAATPMGSLGLSEVHLAGSHLGVELAGILPTNAVSNGLTASWSALDGTFELAQGLRARWKPQSGAGLGAITLTVSDGTGNLGQGVIRLLIDQGLPREHRIDLVTVHNGLLGRQAFAAVPKPVGLATPMPSPTPTATPTPAPTPTPSPSPTTTGNPYPNYSPTPSPSPTPTPTPSPSPTPTPTPSPTQTPAS